MRDKTVEEYCRVIDKLDDGEGVRSIDIARALSLSKNTVALTLQKLADTGFVDMERYGKAKLTGKGAKIAKKMNFRHRVIETFLFTRLRIGREKVHQEACAMEHAVSDDMVRRLYAFIGKPKTDPHGRMIA